jgi:thiamine-phosphate pyrophosphorylase
VSHAWPSWPRLIVVTDLSAASQARWLERVDALTSVASAGAVAVMLRDHQLAARERLAFGRQLRELTLRQKQQLWVADRVDLALILAAEGVHLGERSVPAEALAPLWQGRVSRAWHRPSIGVAQASELAGVGALLLSPVMAERKGRPALGSAALGVLGSQLRARNSAYPQPVYALGGVTAATARACLTAGAWGVAVIGAALTDEPAALSASLGIGR